MKIKSFLFSLELWLEESAQQSGNMRKPCRGRPELQIAFGQVIQWLAIVYAVDHNLLSWKMMDSKCDYFADDSEDSLTLEQIAL